MAIEFAKDEMQKNYDIVMAAVNTDG